MKFITVVIILLILILCFYYAFMQDSEYERLNQRFYMTFKITGGIQGSNKFMKIFSDYSVSVHDLLRDEHIKHDIGVKEIQAIKTIRKHADELKNNYDSDNKIRDGIYAEINVDGKEINISDYSKLPDNIKSAVETLINYLIKN